MPITHDWVMEVGGLRTIYDIANAEITATSIESGVRLTSSPNSVHSAGCLGLRLPMGNGTGTITLCCAPAGRATAHPKPSSFKTSKSDTSLVRMRTRVGATLRSSKLAFCFQRTLGLQLLFLVMALPPSIWHFSSKEKQRKREATKFLFRLSRSSLCNHYYCQWFCFKSWDPRPPSPGPSRPGAVFPELNVWLNGRFVKPPSTCLILCLILNTIDEKL